MVNIILISKNRLFRQCLQTYLESQKLYDSVNHYSLVEDMLQEEQAPGVVIADMAYEFRSFQSINDLIQRHPDVKVLVVANNLQLDEYRQLIDSGVKGAVSCQDDIAELINAVKELAAGKIFYPYNILQQIMMNKPVAVKQTSSLTEREIEILIMLCEGLSNDQISEKIHLSCDTVKWHRSNILNKCECKNILSLYKYAVKNKLVEVTKTR
jgi:DNA-binding NarL/FixJ family response regulator